MLRAALFLTACFLASLVLATLPNSFDARKKWPKCILPILNQGRCGSCWAFSSTTSLSSRFCIHGKAVVNETSLLSPQFLINCDIDHQNGCHGGDTLGAYEYFKADGVDSLQCTKYVSGDTGMTESCKKECDDGGKISKYYKGVSAYSLLKNTTEDTVKAVMEDLYNNGPLSISYLVYQDFLTFFKENPKGIYQHKTGAPLGGHAVRLIGWGEENTVPYWLIANSWGEKWADNGYFRILRGKNEATIESRRISAGMPQLSGAKYDSANPLPKATVLDGARTKIPINNEVLEIARFAMSKKIPGSNDNHGVQEAYAQVVNGILYDFKIATMVENSIQTVEVSVHRSPHDELTLV